MIAAWPWQALIAGAMLLLSLWVMFVVIKGNAQAIERGLIGGAHAIGKLLQLALILGLSVVGLYLLLVLIKFLWRLA